MSKSAAVEDATTPAAPRESFLQKHPRLRRELFILGVALGTGLFLMPTLVYIVGLLTLGPYASGGWVALFGDLYRGLFHGWWAAWSVVLGPLALVCFGRVTRFLYRQFTRPSESV